MRGQIFCEIFKTKSIFINISMIQIHLSHGRKGLTFLIVNTKIIHRIFMSSCQLSFFFSGQKSCLFYL